MNRFKFRHIQQLSSTDIHSLSNLLIEVIHSGASIGFISPFTYEEATSYWSSLNLAEKQLWIATLDEHIIGSVQLIPCNKPNGTHRGEVAKLMVSPQVRRQGIARTLMRVVEKAAIEKNIHLLVLDTRDGDPSNQLYQSLNYTFVGQIPQYARSDGGKLDSTMIYYKLLTS
ncbi:GNAT family N-acetyltransferase [Mechercharimyces sp. CAU 1602]|nr:GNAT family N-acetyltransferase [Mechercharimyces sp. CAU 1602]MCS1350007.1 GNAT family N-acetyltransferase [Mechercharimyces sp. CAU 1602]